MRAAFGMLTPPPCRGRADTQKGFPRTMTQTELETFFKTQGNVLSVRMRRFPNNKKEFKVRPCAGPVIHTRHPR